MRRRDRITGKIESYYWKETHKFDVELPESVEEALAIDRKTQTDFWRKATGKGNEECHAGVRIQGQ